MLQILIDVVNFSTFHIFQVSAVQKCQHCQLCVLRENSTSAFVAERVRERKLQDLQATNHTTVADVRGGQGRAPCWVRFLSFSCSFQEKFGQIIGFCPHLLGLTPPSLENLDPPLPNFSFYYDDQPLVPGYGL